jgi:hypothetical protein
MPKFFVFFMAEFGCFHDVSLVSCWSAGGVGKKAETPKYVIESDGPF